MSKTSYSIGQKIVVKEDFDIKTILSNADMTVKEGDMGFINSKGCLHLLSGKGRGKIVSMGNISVKGYDNDNIANLIFKRLQSEYGIQDFLEENEIEIKDFKDSIWDILSDIL